MLGITRSYWKHNWELGFFGIQSLLLEQLVILPLGILVSVMTSLPELPVLVAVAVPVVPVVLTLKY